MTEQEHNNQQSINTVELMKYAGTVLITIIISMTGFWMMIGREYATRTEVKASVSEGISSLEDKLDIYLKQEEKLSRIIESNTIAINEFRVQIASLGKTLGYLEQEMKKIDERYADLIESGEYRYENK